MLLVVNGYIKTIVNGDIENGCVLIDDDGKIAAVGKDIAAPEGAEIIDACGRLVTPGIVEAHSHIGLRGTALRWEATETNETVDPITPQLRVIDGINPIDEQFENAVKYGVTSACVAPGSANVIGGTAAAIKLTGSVIAGAERSQCLGNFHCGFAFYSVCRRNARIKHCFAAAFFALVKRRGFRKNHRL